MLRQAIQGISDLILVPGLINLDFADVKTIMAGMGIAIMGTGVAEGENRAMDAANRAISSPLLEDASVNGARGVIINVTGGPDLSLIEVSEASAIIQEAAHEDANIIFGAVVDPKMAGQGEDHRHRHRLRSARGRQQPACRRVGAVTPVDLQLLHRVASRIGERVGRRRAAVAAVGVAAPGARDAGWRLAGGDRRRRTRSARAPSSSRCRRSTCRRSCAGRTRAERARGQAGRETAGTLRADPRARASAVVSARSRGRSSHLIHMARSQAREADGARDATCLDVLSQEVGYIRKPHGGRLRVALAFPNTYFVGMSNLGFQTVYRLFNELDDVVCERVFLPGRQELPAQLASGTPLLHDRIADAGPRLRRLRVLGLVRVGLHQRRVHAAAGRHAGRAPRRGPRTIRWS